jgi:hypothetical protein
MPKTADDLQKHTLNFYAGDFDRIRVLWPDQEPSVIIREFIHDMIEKHEAVATSKVDGVKVELK